MTTPLLNKALQQTLFEFLTTRFPIEKASESADLIVIFKIHNLYATYALNAKTYDGKLTQNPLAAIANVQACPSLFLNRYLNDEQQQHVLQVLRFLNPEETKEDKEWGTLPSHLNLWITLNSYLKTMPGFWSVFSPLRPLSRALKSTLANYVVTDLNQQDYLLSSQVIKSLKRSFEELLSRFNTLVTQLKALKQENDSLLLLVEQGRMSASFVEEKVQNKIKELLQQKECLSLELNQTRERYQQVCQHYNLVRTQHQELLKTNQTLVQRNSALEEETEWLHNALEMTVFELEDKNQLVENWAQKAARSQNKPASIAELNAQYQKLHRKSAQRTFFKSNTDISTLEENENNLESDTKSSVTNLKSH